MSLLFLLTIKYSLCPLWLPKNKGGKNDYRRDEKCLHVFGDQ
jgi:hypothetical protein